MRIDRRWLTASLVGAGLGAATGPTVMAQVAIPAPVLPPPAIAVPPRPAPVAGHVHGGPVRRAVEHAAYAVHDHMIGEPERFAVPPLGWYVGNAFATQAANADQHWFTLYRSDFYAGTERLTPEGVRRLDRMVRRWHCWPGPLLVEFDPNTPGLAESRRLAVIGALGNAGAPIDPARLVVGGSPYLGERGALADEYNAVLLQRSIAAPTALSLPPLPGADFGN